MPTLARLFNYNRKASRMGKIYLLLLPVCMLACRPPKKKEIVKETIVDSAMNHTANAAMDLPDVEGCYSMVIGKDSAFLQLKRSGNEITGDLLYDRHDK